MIDICHFLSWYCLLMISRGWTDKLNWSLFLPIWFSKEIIWNWYDLCLKHLVIHQWNHQGLELTFLDIVLLRVLFHLEWILVVCIFQEIGSSVFQIYWHRIICNIFILISKDTYRVFFSFARSLSILLILKKDNF